MGFLGKVTGADYLNKDGASPDSEKKDSPKKEVRDLSKHDEKLLKTLEQTLKKVNNQIEDMLEKVRVRRGY